MRADELREGIIDRGVNEITGSWLTMMRNTGIFGHGIGSATVIGRVLSGENERRLVVEEEWTRIIFESGPVIGFCYILLRVWLVLFLFIRSYRSLIKDSNTLPLLIFGASAMNILNGQLGQTTELGFAVLGAGLCLSACNLDSAKTAVQSSEIRAMAK
jgi:hypothetical protein